MNKQNYNIFSTVGDFKKVFVKEKNTGELVNLLEGIEADQVEIENDNISWTNTKTGRTGSIIRNAKPFICEREKHGERKKNENL